MAEERGREKEEKMRKLYMIPAEFFEFKRALSGEERKKPSEILSKYHLIPGEEYEIIVLWGFDEEIEHRIARER